jgi:N-acetylmuramoyl-L-alanine amidase
VRGTSLPKAVRISPNIDDRAGGQSPRLVVLHYTGMASGPAAIDWLCNVDSRVSCHYLVDVDGSICQMVDEDMRAWHAGVSSWQGAIDTNSASIGIEIQNEGHAAKCPAFPMRQMESVRDLCLDIMSRHNLGPQRIVAHSDVAPGRKIDPGEAFDWGWLAAYGVGCRVSAAAGSTTPNAETTRHALRQIGYGVEPTGDGRDRFRVVLEAVQRRYRPGRVDGQLDTETGDIIRRLQTLLPTRETIPSV